MAQITAAMVKELREMTDSPMMECKKALVEADGDLEKAVDVLRTMGMAKAVKKAGRETNEGTIGAFVCNKGGKGALVEVTCETDFVGSNAKFTAFADALAKVAAKNQVSDVEALKACEFDEKDTVETALTEMIHTLGENMKINRVAVVQVEDGALSSYVHSNGKLADIVEFKIGKPATAETDEFKSFGHDVAMQVAAAGPICARRDDVPAETIAHEKSIYMAQAAESGKPEAIQEKMATGRLEKFFKESVLTEQAFIKNGDVTISELAKQTGKACDDTIEVMSFVRFIFGE